VKRYSCHQYQLKENGCGYNEFEGDIDTIRR